MSESSVDKSIVPEYSELFNVDDNKSTADAITVTANNINNNNLSNNKNPTAFVDAEIIEISTQPAVIPQSITPVKAIEKQIETRRADGKRRITPMFVPLQDRYVHVHAHIHSDVFHRMTVIIVNVKKKSRAFLSIIFLHA